MAVASTGIEDAGAIRDWTEKEATDEEAETTERQFTEEARKTEGDVPMSTNDLIYLVEQLQEWLENHDGLPSVPSAWVAITEYTNEIGIGPFTLWDSENYYADEQDYRNEDVPTIEGLIDCFRNQIRELTEFLR